MADAHTEINEALEQLRAAGYGEDDSQPLPTGNTRDLCRQWVQAGWLVRQVSDDDVEVYRLSAYGVGALEVAGRVAARCPCPCPRIMCVQRKTGHDTDRGPAWIACVQFTRTWRAA
ncbi:DUF3375 family protein [Winogradskya humida]|uniref:DUF3375 family protein n=1 Tax=Winogradskya humida TaxID=113566 RepID=UPI001EF32C89|nr:DUF3375 family protein [Actinoplanes humidus]